MVVTDPYAAERDRGVLQALVRRVPRLARLRRSETTPRATPRRRRVSSSADYLADHLAEVPVLVLACIEAGAELPAENQAGLWGSLLPAAWSYQLAARARGLGTAWTTLHLTYEREVAELLGIPPHVRQGVLLPDGLLHRRDVPAGAARTAGHRAPPRPLVAARHRGSCRSAALLRRSSLIRRSAPSTFRDAFLASGYEFGRHPSRVVRGGRYADRDDHDASLPASPPARATGLLLARLSSGRSPGCGSSRRSGSCCSTSTSPALDGVGAAVDVLGPLVTAGALGVDLFFVLSGFVIAHTYLDRLGPALRLRRDRPLRLGPRLPDLARVRAGVPPVRDLGGGAAGLGLGRPDRLPGGAAGRQPAGVPAAAGPGPAVGRAVLRRRLVGGLDLVDQRGVAGLPAVPGGRAGVLPAA